MPDGIPKNANDFIEQQLGIIHAPGEFVPYY